MTAAVVDPSFLATENPLGLCGIEFIEFAGPKTQEDSAHFDRIFTGLGFSRLRQHHAQPITYFQQNDIHFLVNFAPSGFAAQFAQQHGRSACAMGLRVASAKQALETAVQRGAKPVPENAKADHPFPAIYGIGDSLIYFVESSIKAPLAYYQTAFQPHPEPLNVAHKGFLFVDHLTNNVHKGTRDTWASFYKDVFGFVEVRYFDIKGEKTGLTSYALRSPCGTFCIPINEGNEDKSQIEEYLREYQGPGIQHIALASQDLLSSLDQLSGSGIETLDIDADYYEEAFQRVPNVTEDRTRIEHHQVLIDGDEEGYLLQIFTKNLFGPIFFELIQRKNHFSFGEGNFGALFKSIERDQARRGVL
ncbi:MAG: 4-hydroxyphenylpyruvate dioxygenase [Cyanobacteria bacterium]|nr:4-hydroxyphenylpyruvate dioxygenase [Cyanobacteriota bacterium]